MAKRQSAGGRGHLPTKDELIAFLRERGIRTPRREIIRAFGLKGKERTEVLNLLKEIKAEARANKGARRPRNGLPPVGVIEITEIDADGDAVARPAAWRGDDAPPTIYLARGRPGMPAPAPGDRILARLSRAPDGSYVAQPIKRLPGMPSHILGVYRAAGDGGRLIPTERGKRKEFLIDAGDAMGAASGELVSAEILGQKVHGLTRARVVERLGDVSGPRAASLIAIHAAGLPVEFPPEVLADAASLTPATAEGRVDLRGVPLVTIDGADARDFDDAVHAAPDDDPENPGGWRLTVAIADVAWYVRPGDLIDREAYRRGNSTYFPDRVVPMLPEALSNDLCSLRPQEDRACMAAQLWIGADGSLRRHSFQRALMRSAARLTYEQVQAAAGGHPDSATEPLLQGVIEPLYGAFAALDAARRRRGALALELPERQLTLAADGSVAQVTQRTRLDSHRLIEEFMIAANVAAAETLERRRRPCMYRVHDTPDPIKVEALRDVLAGLGHKFARAQVLEPALFNRILERVAGSDHERLVNVMILRAQAQAVYSPGNLGHFGLGLGRYAHFTSPIRRYADLLVHRALIAGLGLGEAGLPAEMETRMGEAGQHLSMTERRSMAAERDAMDRYLAAYLSERIGATFNGHITGVTRFGLFVALEDNGAEGLVPMSTLPGGPYRHDARRHTLEGKSGRLVFTLGAPVEVRLAEADAARGGMVFHLSGKASAARSHGPRSHGPRRGRVKGGRKGRR